MNAYKTTTVATHKSQEGIRKILLAQNVRGVQFTEDFDTRQIGLRFAKDVNGTMRTVSVSMTIPEAPTPKRRIRNGRYIHGRMVYTKTAQERQEQMARATYRALHYWIKSQFEAVDFGLLSFEDVFLSHFEWMIGGQTTTLGKAFMPYLERPMLKAPKMDDIIEGEAS